VCRSGDAPIVVREKGEEIGGSAASEWSADALDESRIAYALERGHQTPLELVLALAEGCRIERVLGHVTEQCNKGPSCHRIDTMALCGVAG
jgi:hypothetical protein